MWNSICRKLCIIANLKHFILEILRTPVNSSNASWSCYTRWKAVHPKIFELHIAISLMLRTLTINYHLEHIFFFFFFLQSVMSEPTCVHSINPPDISYLPPARILKTYWKITLYCSFEPSVPWFIQWKARPLPDAYQSRHTAQAKLYTSIL